MMTPNFADKTVWTGDEALAGIQETGKREWAKILWIPDQVRNDGLGNHELDADMAQQV